MADKLTDIFAVSRMMLPEHKQRIIHLNWEEDHYKGPKPVLDEQELEEIGRTLMESKELRQPVKVKLYHPYEDLLTVGIVERIEPQFGWFQVDGERFTMDDIVSAEVDEES